MHEPTAVVGSTLNILYDLPMELIYKFHEHLSVKDKLSLAGVSRAFYNFEWSELKKELQKDEALQRHFDIYELPHQDIVFLLNAKKYAQRTYEQIKQALDLKEKPANERTRDDFINAQILTREQADEISDDQFSWLNQNAHLALCTALLPLDRMGCISAVIPYVLHDILSDNTELEIDQKLEVAKIMLSSSQEIDLKINEYYEGNTALHWASKLGEAELVNLLIKHGAAVDQLTDEKLSFTLRYEGNTPRLVQNESTSLHLSVEKGHLDVAKCLIAAGAQVDTQDITGKTPLVCAIQRACNYYTKPSVAADYLEIAGCLLDKLDPCVPITGSIEGGSLLHAVCAAPKTIDTRPMIERLLKRKIDINALNSEKESALDLAAMQGDQKRVEFLIAANKEARLNDQTIGKIIKKGIQWFEKLTHRSPPNEGIEWFKLARFLLEKGFSASARLGASEDTALHLVCKSRAIPEEYAFPIIITLIKKNGLSSYLDPMNPNPNPLDLLDADRIERLFKSNIDESGNTLIHWAASRGEDHAGMIACLIKKVANVPLKDLLNAKNHEGSTSLHAWAAGKSEIDMAQLLIQHGAEVNARNREGLTPLDVIKVSLNKDPLNITAQTILKQAGAYYSWQVKILHFVQYLYQMTIQTTIQWVINFFQQICFSLARLLH